jgi:hypothetical protein
LYAAVVFRQNETILFCVLKHNGMSSIKIKIIISQPLFVAMKLCRTARPIRIFFVTGQSWLVKKEFGADMDVAFHVIILVYHFFTSPDLYIHNIGTAYT